MRARTPLSWRCVILVAALVASAAAWAEPDGWAINSRGDFFDSSRVGALWSLDLANGQATLEGRSRIQPFIFIEGLSISPEGHLFGVDDDTNTLIRVGTSSGNAVAVEQQIGNLGLPLGNHDFGMTFTCEGRLLISADSATLGLSLYEADPETGQVSRIGDLGAPIVDMASLGDRVFGIGRGMATASNPAAPQLYLIDTETGRAEPVGPLGNQAALYNKAGLATDSEGTLWAVTDRRDPSNADVSLASQILRIDPATGQAQRVAEVVSSEGEGLVGIESLAIAPPGDCSRGGPGAAAASPIPVLSDLALWTLGLLMLVLAAGALRRLDAS